jgi:pimeloyl-ACP methyl ester carboxylesterase
MVHWRSMLAVFGCIVAAALVGSGSAVAGTGCGHAAQLVCSTVEVPLDRTGQIAGTVGLHVEMLRSQGVNRGVLFLVAGGPGQGSAQSFNLGSPTSAFFFRFLFPGYTLVAYDDRGTGRSNPLDCAALDRAGVGDDIAAVAANCAAQLGPAASFYSTADHAADLDAVRQALGLDRIAIMGVSYGTKLALDYAASYPAHVDRLVLDSVVRPDAKDPFSTSVLQAMPATLANYCAGVTCAQATSDFAGDVAAVANELAAQPINERVLLPNGTKTTATLDALTFLGMVVAADSNPGLAAELPAAVHAARTGDPQPLLHVLQLNSSGAPTPASAFNSALYLATVCDDGPFPWLPDTPLADRANSTQSALAALPPGSFGPFGTWAASIGNTDACAGWPNPIVDVPAPAATLPDVPVLAFSGGLDLRTPTANAAAVVAQFPQGHLVVVPGVGHSVLSMDPSLCSQLALRKWLLAGTVPKQACPRAKAFVQPVAAFTPAPTKPLTPQQTRTVATNTLHEAEAIWFAATGLSGQPASLAGIYDGKLVARATAFTLNHYSITKGVTLTGHIRITNLGTPTRFAGTLTITGTLASQGNLTLAHGTLTGRLNNRNIGP